MIIGEISVGTSSAFLPFDQPSIGPVVEAFKPSDRLVIGPTAEAFAPFDVPTQTQRSCAAHGGLGDSVVGNAVVAELHQQSAKVCVWQRSSIPHE